MKKRMDSIPALSVLFSLLAPMAFPQEEAGSPAQGARPAEKDKALADVPQTLEEMLQSALRSNPEILIAEAKLREAQVKLNQTRLRVTKEVVSLYNQRRNREVAAKVLKEELATVRQKIAIGRAGGEDERKAILAQAEAEAALSEVEAHMRYVLGNGGELRSLREVPERRVSPAVSRLRSRLPMPENFRALMENPIELHLHDYKTLEMILAEIKEAAGSQVTFVFDPAVDASALMARMDFPAPIPLRSALLALHDQCRGICFVFRDYGILVTDEDTARKTPGAAIPPETPFEAPEVPPEGQGKSP